MNAAIVRISDLPQGGQAVHVIRGENRQAVFDTESYAQAVADADAVYWSSDMDFPEDRTSDPAVLALVGELQQRRSKSWRHSRHG